jgi:hypothetical protein
MSLIDLLIDLRTSILQLIRGVENSRGSLCWDTTTPNAATRHALRKLLSRQLSAVQRFGVYQVTRHTCPLPEHAGYVIEPGAHGITEFGDARFRWAGHQLYQGARVSACPCAIDARPTRHDVIDELIVRTYGTCSRPSTKRVREDAGQPYVNTCLEPL